MTDASIDFQAKTRKIPPRILCIGMPVRDLTFRVPGLPARGSKEHASHVQEICGGNALKMPRSVLRAVVARPRSAGRWAMPAKPPAATSSSRWLMRGSTPAASCICRA